MPTFQVKGQENRVSQEELSIVHGGAQIHMSPGAIRNESEQSQQEMAGRKATKVVCIDTATATLAKEFVFVSLGLWFFLPVGGAMFRFKACCSSALIACSRRMLLGDLARMKRLQSGQILFS